jgi:hypothetical protein
MARPLLYVDGREVNIMMTLAGIGAMGTASMGTAVLSWPFLGTVVAWGLIAALVGSGLGMLRHIAAWGPTTVAKPAGREGRPGIATHHLDVCHRSAA